MIELGHLVKPVRQASYIFSFVVGIFGTKYGYMVMLSFKVLNSALFRVSQANSKQYLLPFLEIYH